MRELPSQTTKSAWVPNDWRRHHSDHAGTIKFESGPRTGPCPIHKGDSVILAAAGWSRAFAAVRVVDNQEIAAEPRWGPRWPWVLHGDAVAWVERVEHGPKLADVGLRSYGAAFFHITQEQYEETRSRLRALGQSRP